MQRIQKNSWKTSVSFPWSFRKTSSDQSKSKRFWAECSQSSKIKESHGHNCSNTPLFNPLTLRKWSQTPKINWSKVTTALKHISQETKLFQKQPKTSNHKITIKSRTPKLSLLKKNKISMKMLKLKKSSWRWWAKLRKLMRKWGTKETSLCIWMCNVTHSLQSLTKSWTNFTFILVFICCCPTKSTFTETSKKSSSPQNLSTKKSLKTSGSLTWNRQPSHA